MTLTQNEIDYKEAIETHLPEIKKVFDYESSDWNEQGGYGWELVRGNDVIFIWFSLKGSCSELEPEDFDKSADNEITFQVELENGETVKSFDNINDLCSFLKNL